MPLRLRSNGRHGDASISRRALKPLKVSRARASVPPGQSHIETAETNGIRGLADRDRARRASRDDARALTFEPVAMRNDIAGRVDEVIPRLRWARARDAVGDRGEEIVFVTNQVGRPGPQHDADTCWIEIAVEQSRVLESFVGGDNTHPIRA